MGKAEAEVVPSSSLVEVGVEVGVEVEAEVEAEVEVEVGIKVEVEVWVEVWLFFFFGWGVESGGVEGLEKS